MAEAVVVTAVYGAGDLGRILELGPGRLDGCVQWWKGGTIPYQGGVWGAIGRRSYHLGELVYLRQVLGLAEPRYYHEE